MNGKRSHNFRVFTNFLAFLILVIVAILLIVARLVSPAAGYSIILIEIAKYIAIFLVALASLWYVVSKRSLLVKVVWFIAVATIIILMFI